MAILLGRVPGTVINANTVFTLQGAGNWYIENVWFNPFFLTTSGVNGGAQIFVNQSIVSAQTLLAFEWDEGPAGSYSLKSPVSAILNTILPRGAGIQISVVLFAATLNLNLSVFGQQLS